MGKYLDQCAKDAWDVIKGKKKIVGNAIVDINEEEPDCTDKTDTEYGWLSPDGVFYSVDFSKHQTWAAKFIKGLYNNGSISIEELRKAGSNDHAGDWLVNRGWVLIHNPTQHKIQITSNDNFTKAQKEFLYDFLCRHGKFEEANVLYK